MGGKRSTKHVPYAGCKSFKNCKKDSDDPRKGARLVTETVTNLRPSYTYCTFAHIKGTKSFVLWKLRNRHAQKWPMYSSIVTDT